MLTRDDLQAIQQIVKVEVKKKLRTACLWVLKPIYKELRKLRKDLNITITSFDNEIIDTRRRVDRIEGPS